MGIVHEGGNPGPYVDDRMPVVPGAMQTNIYPLTKGTSVNRVQTKMPIHMQGIMQQKLNCGSASPVRFPLRLCGILLLLLVITGCGICQPAAADSSGVPIKIGVLAHKGIDECTASWQPTMDYL
ncbi:MAG: hypothetical protein NTV68_01740, partial [Methanomicrobiales archaeon]|nr:hypothetical protein [Methanomicrobiales archaeon]